MMMLDTPTMTMKLKMLISFADGHADDGDDTDEDVDDCVALKKKRCAGTKPSIRTECRPK